MLTSKQYQKLKENEKPCPYGRNAYVGTTICVNCRFYHINENECSGEVDTVRQHMDYLKLGY